MTNEDTDARRRRLQALREKHARQTSADVPDDAGGDAPVTEGRATGLGARGAGLGLGGGRPGPFGGGKRRRAGGMRRGGTTEAQGRGESVQRLLKFLTQPGPGGRLIPGTSIKEDRIKQVMQFLRHRANNAEGPAAKRLQRAVAFLTREQEGVPMVAGVNVAHLQKLIAILQGRAGQGAAAEGGGEELDGVFEELVEERAPAAASAPPVQQPDPAIASTLSELVGITQRLSEQLEATQRQVREMAQERAAPALPEADEAAEEEQPQKAKRPGGDWFEEFLE